MTSEQVPHNPTETSQPSAQSSQANFQGTYRPPLQDLQPAPYQTPYGAAFASGYASKPRPHVGYIQAHRNWFKYMFHFSGRASRSEYWWVQLTFFAITTVLTALALVTMMTGVISTDPSTGQLTETGTIAAVAGFGIYVILLILGLVFAIAGLGLSWRRMQDAGFPGALCLLSFIGLGIVPFIFSLLPSKPAGYQYDRPEDFNRP